MNKSHKGIMFFAILLIIGICSTTGYVMLDKLGGNIYNNSTSDISLNSWKLVLDIDDNNVSIDKTNIKINRYLLNLIPPMLKILVFIKNTPY